MTRNTKRSKIPQHTCYNYPWNPNFTPFHSIQPVFFVLQAEHWALQRRRWELGTFDALPVMLRSLGGHSVHCSENQPELGQERLLEQRKTPQQTPFGDIQMNVVVSYWQIYVYHYRSPTTQNLSDLDFDLSRSLKIKCDCVIGLPIYGFLIMCNSSIGPNMAPLRDIRL